MIKLDKLNVAKKISNNLVGENHTHVHRMMVGSAIMILGVLVAFSATGTHVVIHIFLDMLGYGIHGIGAVPFVDYFITASKTS